MEEGGEGPQPTDGPYCNNTYIERPAQTWDGRCHSNIQIRRFCTLHIPPFSLSLFKLWASDAIKGLRTLCRIEKGWCDVLRSRDVAMTSLRVV